METKVKAAGVAAALGTLLLYLVKQFTGVELPPPVGIAIVTLLTLLLGYVIPENNPSDSTVSVVRSRMPRTPVVPPIE